MQKEECLYNNLTEKQFNKTWKTLKGMVGLMKTDYELEDLSYEEIDCPLREGSENLTNHQVAIHIDTIHNTRYN